jgi:uncharacterized protein
MHMTMNRWLLPLALFGAAACAPAEAQIAGFDCHKAQTDTEWAICNTPELGKLDVRMSTAYSLLQMVAPASRFTSLLRQSQSEWLGQRNACGGAVACLTRIYNSRLTTFDEIAHDALAVRE